MIPTILCVDDDSGMTRMMSDTLSARGFEVVAAASVGEAMSVVRSRKVDLVVLDILLPGTDGYGFLDQLAAEHLPRQIPVIMASGCTGEEPRRMAIQHGAVAYLPKPFQIQQLMTLINRMVAVP